MKSSSTKLATLAIALLMVGMLSSCHQFGTVVKALKGSAMASDVMHHGEQIVSEHALSASIDQIDARSYIKVVLRYAETPGLKVTAPDTKRQLTIKEEADGRLVLFEDKETFKSEDGAFLVEVFTPTALKGVKAHGATVIEVADVRWQEQAELKLSGASRLSSSALAIAEKLNLDLTGASFVSIDTLQCTEMDLDCSGASSAVYAHLKVRLLEADCSGASDITLSGEADQVKLNASGASDIVATQLKGRRGDIQASGASSVHVSVSEEISMEASGASDIRYHGSPTVLSSKSSGSSDITQK